MIHFIHPCIIPAGHIHGTGDGVTAGIHLTAGGVSAMGIHPTTAHGTAHTTHGAILIIIHGMEVTTMDITEVTAITEGMLILTITDTGEGEHPEQTCFTGIPADAGHQPLRNVRPQQLKKAEESEQMNVLMLKAHLPHAGVVPVQMSG
jgi:hypothetical protein